MQSLFALKRIIRGDFMTKFWFKIFFKVHLKIPEKNTFCQLVKNDKKFNQSI